jgi:hypothetical protein
VLWLLCKMLEVPASRCILSLFVTTTENELNIKHCKLLRGPWILAQGVFISCNKGYFFFLKILGEYGGKLWTGYIWLRIGTSGRLL